MKNAVPSECKQCSSFWKHGVKDGKHNRWCCKYGKPATQVISHCRLKGGFSKKEF